MFISIILCAKAQEILFRIHKQESIQNSVWFSSAALNLPFRRNNCNNRFCFDASISFVGLFFLVCSRALDANEYAICLRVLTAPTPLGLFFKICVNKRRKIEVSANVYAVDKRMSAF